MIFFLENSKYMTVHQEKELGWNKVIQLSELKALTQTEVF